MTRGFAAKPQRHVGVLGGILGRLGDFDAIECHPGLPALVTSLKSMVV
jgi:hypothetical protein